MAIQVSTIQVRGKLGNAVGYKRSGARRSGANFARVYTDEVRDPQTPSQLYQRAIAATVSKAYAAMSRICDHSFQGSAVGAESMQRFYSLNLNQLRRDVMRDLSDPVTDPVDMFGSVVAPRSAFPTCYSYVVSEGTLTNSFLRVSSIDAQICVLFPAALSAQETVSAYVRRCGLVRGDIFTALGLGVLDPEGAFASQFGQLASQPSTSFGFIRFKLKDAAFSDSSPVSEAAVSQVFSVEYGGQATPFADDELPERAVFSASITGGDDGFLGVIRSRRNSPLRSSCRLMGTLTDGTVSEESKYGIKSAYLLNAWLPEQDTLGQSSLILEGGGFPEPVPPAPAPVVELLGYPVTQPVGEYTELVLAVVTDGEPQAAKTKYNANDVFAHNIIQNGKLPLILAIGMRDNEPYAQFQDNTQTNPSDLPASSLLEFQFEDTGDDSYVVSLAGIVLGTWPKSDFQTSSQKSLQFNLYTI